MTVDFHHIFSRKGMRGAHDNDQRLIKWQRIAMRLDGCDRDTKHIRVVKGMAPNGAQRSAGSETNQFGGVRDGILTADADDPDSSFPYRSGDGANRFVH